MTCKIAVEINPMNEKWCGMCRKLSSYLGCRFYCSILGNEELNYDLDGNIMRHPDCIKAEKEAMK